MAKRKAKRWTNTDVKKAPRKAKSKGNTGAPMCKLCKTAHWSREPHKFKPSRNGIQYDDIRVRE